MRAFVHIIVEQLHGRWSAWISGAPEVAVGGALPADAVRRLLNSIGDWFDVEQISAVDEATREGHLEFRIPYREQRWIPVPSVN